jgi:hypothetical protein
MCLASFPARRRRAGGHRHLLLRAQQILRALPQPSSLPASNRLQPTETTVYVVDATLTEYKLETDSDYHLVIKDASGNTMIVEIPSPSCVGSGSPFASKIGVSRSTFDAK